MLDSGYTRWMDKSCIELIKEECKHETKAGSFIYMTRLGVPRTRCGKCNELFDIEIESKQMETKTEKWQIDDGNVIEVELNIKSPRPYYNVESKLYGLYGKDYIAYRPFGSVEEGTLGDFAMFLEDGTTKTAKYIKPEYEFKVGDVVDTDYGVGKIIDISGNRGFPPLYQVNVHLDCNFYVHKVKLIASFEDWCKDNLPDYIELHDAEKWDSIDLHVLAFPNKQILGYVGKHWKLIYKIKIAQSYIDAVKEGK